MDKKELTSIQKSKREYEERNKEERKKTSAQFSTFIPRKLYNEINAFLKKHNMTKVSLIYSGYHTLLESIDEYEKHKAEMQSENKD